MTDEDRSRLQKIPRLAGAIGRTYQVDGDLLGDFLHEMHPLVTVGITAGSSFLFIGTVRSFLKEGSAYVDFFYTRQRAFSYVKNATGDEYKPYYPMLSRKVLSYSSRSVPGDPAIWVISIEGDEIGGVWLLSEMAAWQESCRKQMANRRGDYY